MSNICFILGAGASKQAGGPLMMDFLDRAKELHRLGKFPDAAESFDRVFNGMSELGKVHSKCDLDTVNVESVFAAFEMAKTINKLGDYTSEEIEELIVAMKRVIVHTIEETIHFPVIGRKIQVPRPYYDFVSLVADLKRNDRQHVGRSVSIITFNYDMALDFAFYNKRIPITYGLKEEEGRSPVPILKLHGSLNWAYCEKCKEVVSWKLSDYLKPYDGTIHLMDFTSFTLDIGSKIFSHFTHCGIGSDDREPIIVPPTWNKTEHHRNLSQVWIRAARELSDVENIFVIGYSLPESDAFFRNLYALGTVSPTMIDRFWVFDPSASKDVPNRFKNLLGPGAEQRFRYFQETFEAAISIIRQSFPV